MFAVAAKGMDPADPLGCLYAGAWPEPEPGPGWTTVTVRAAALNMHDVWTLRGVAPPGGGCPSSSGPTRPESTRTATRSSSTR